MHTRTKSDTLRAAIDAAMKDDAQRTAEIDAIQAEAQVEENLKVMEMAKSIAWAKRPGDLEYDSWGK